MRNLTIEISKSQSVCEAAVEIVERKGVGHPDFICDAAMERVSVELSRHYIKRFGTVLHHNIDKGLLVAGRVKKGFGGGRVIKPMELMIGDRAAFSAGGKKIPVAEIAEATVRGWFRENLRHVDADKDLDVRVVLQPGSVELADIFGRRARVRAANDTSASVGYAPLTPTEKAVLDAERFINSTAFKLAFPETGEDVKVMGIRRGRSLDLTIACPLMAGLIKSEKDYFKKKAELKKALLDYLRTGTLSSEFRDINISLNTLDRRGRGVEGVYLSLLGTSAEDADSGQVGRGNRVNGVISLNRPMGTEAAAGKNPVSHVGKIYTILAHKMAGELYLRVDGIKEVYVWLLSRIGAPIDKPAEVYVRVIQGRRLDKKRLDATIKSVMEEALVGMRAFTEALSMGEYQVC